MKLTGQKIDRRTARPGGRGAPRPPHPAATVPPVRRVDVEATPAAEAVEDAPRARPARSRREEPRREQVQREQASPGRTARGP